MLLKLAIQENIRPVELAQYGFVYPLGSIRTHIGPALLDDYFLVLDIRGLCHGSFKSSLGNTRCLEGNIAIVIFQYSIVW